MSEIVILAVCFQLKQLKKQPVNRAYEVTDFVMCTY